MQIHLLDLAGLFAAAFLSGSFLPFQSELVLLGMAASERHQIWLLLIVASCGNVMGAVVNWYLGRYLTKFEGRRWFPIKKAALEKAERWYSRYGQWSLLLSWVPVIGDPLTMAAGLMKTNFWIFLILVTIAKTGRYLVLLMIAGSSF